MSFFYSLQFLFRPIRFLKLIKNIIKKRPETMLDLAISGMIEDFLKGRRINVEN
jgi:hypothetical protein